MKAKELIQSKFSRDTIWLTMAQFIVICSGFFINVYIGHARGIAELGFFHQSLAFYMILSTVFAFGLNNSILKKVSENSALNIEFNQLFINALSLTLILGSLLTAGLIAISIVFPELFSSLELVTLLRSHLIALPIFCLNKNFAAYYSAQRNQLKIALIRVFRWGGEYALS